MVRFDDWEVFSARARRLVASTLDADAASKLTSTSSISKKKRRLPRVARCVVKYEHSRGKLAVRVTDDVTCLQFATDRLSDVKRVERLAAWLVTAQATGSAEKATAEVGGGGGGSGAVEASAAAASAAAAPLKAAKVANAAGGGRASGSKGKGGSGSKGRARG